MSLTSFKSCKKYLLSYKDSLNNIHQLGIYAIDAYECLMLAKEFNTYLHDHPNSVTRIQLKVWCKLIMILKTTQLSIQDNNIKDLDDSTIKHPNFDDLMTEQNITNNDQKTVHRRRDLDSLG